MSEKLNLKTPVTYYGGKQQLVKEIVPLIPEHKLYCEPFAGGAAIFWAKQPSELEVLNDTNSELMNFYKVVKTRYLDLEKEIKITLNSRDAHRKASTIYNNPDMFDDIKRAWALWTLSHQGFASKIDSSWGYDRSKNRTAKKVNNARESFSEELAIRLQNCSLECADAIYIINSRDSVDSFFYCDPPYYNSNMGHYDGYSINDYEELLQSLTNIKGKFLLSSYPSDILKKYTHKYNWHTKQFNMRISVNAKAQKEGTGKQKKIEVLTANFEI